MKINDRQPLIFVHYLHITVTAFKRHLVKNIFTIPYCKNRTTFKNISLKYILQCWFLKLSKMRSKRRVCPELFCEYKVELGTYVKYGDCSFLKNWSWGDGGILI